MKLQVLAAGIALGDAQHEVREQGGENRGPWVQKYLANTDPPINVAAPWCAAWLHFVADRAADELMVPNPLDGVRQEALVASYWSWASKTGRLIDVAKTDTGDLVLFNFGGKGWNHIGFVVRPPIGSRLYTVEGNTSPGVGATSEEKEREGDGVFTKARSIGQFPMAAIRWAA